MSTLFDYHQQQLYEDASQAAFSLPDGCRDVKQAIERVPISGRQRSLRTSQDEGRGGWQSAPSAAGRQPRQVDSRRSTFSDGSHHHQDLGQVKSAWDATSVSNLRQQRSISRTSMLSVSSCKDRKSLDSSSSSTSSTSGTNQRHAEVIILTFSH